MVDALITFQVVAFGREDRHNTLRQKEIQDPPHLLFELFRPPDLIGPKGKDSKRRPVQAQLTSQRRFARLADLQIAFRWIQNSCGIEAPPGSCTNPPKGALKLSDDRQQALIRTKIIITFTEIKGGEEPLCRYLPIANL